VQKQSQSEGSVEGHENCVLLGILVDLDDGWIESEEVSDGLVVQDGFKFVKIKVGRLCNLGRCVIKRYAGVIGEHQEFKVSTSEGGVVCHTSVVVRDEPGDFIIGGAVWNFLGVEEVVNDDSTEIVIECRVMNLHGEQQVILGDLVEFEFRDVFEVGVGREVAKGAGDSSCVRFIHVHIVSRGDSVVNAGACSEGFSSAVK